MHARQLALAVGAISAMLCGGAMAAHGGGGGDSSMNPFYGDSYAYFNGHNLGEQAMIIPGRTPAAQASFARRMGSQAPAPPPQPTVTYRKVVPAPATTLEWRPEAAQTR